MNSGRVVYMNGDFVEEENAKISIYDSALMFGDMVFEMTRSFNKQQFKLREHLERLYMGLKILRIPVQMSIEEMEQACFQTIELNDRSFESHDEHRLMINVSRGPLGIYAPIFGGKMEPTVVIADFPLKWTSQAWLAFTTKESTRSSHPKGRFRQPDGSKIKNRSRMWYQMANIEVAQVEGDNNWALLIDPDGYIAEGTGDNFFMIKNGCLMTPEGRNILRGISRSYVMELADQLNLECRECNIEPFDLYEADEAFLTATPFCILPTTHLNGVPIGSGQMGTITQQLLDQWSQNVGLDIVQQIRDYAKEVENWQQSNAPTPYQFLKK